MSTVHLLIPAREPITAWAVRMPSGAISLFLDQQRATQYATAHRATLHLLIEAVGTQPMAQQAHPQAPMPRGDLNTHGVMRV